MAVTEEQTGNGSPLMSRDEKVKVKDAEYDLDTALGVVGGYKRWNFFAFFLLGCSCFISICWQGLGVIFLGWSPPHKCHSPVPPPLNSSIVEQQCEQYTNLTSLGPNVTEACEQWDYENLGYSTIVTEWDLVCNNNYLSEFSQTIYQGGSLLAQISISYFIDRFGRKKVHIVANLGVAIIGAGCAFTQSYIAFIATRTAIGYVSQATVSSGILWVMEIFDARRQSFVGIGIEYMWVFVYCWLPLLAMYITDWRTLQLVLSLVPLVVVLFFWFIPESPDWLASYRRYDEAEKALQRMAVMNGVPAPDLTLTREVVPVTSEPKVKVPVSDLFFDPKLRLHVCVVGFLWFSNCIVYYGLLLATPTMAGNRFLNFFLMGLVEIPAYSLTMILIDRVSRRMLIVVFHFIAGVALLAITFIPRVTTGGTDLTLLITLLALGSKFGITGSFACIVLYSKEVFPTTLRGTAWGVTGICGTVGNMIAPFVSYMGKSYPWVPNCLLAGISILAGIQLLFGPETLNKPVAMTVDDIYTIFYPGVKRKKRTTVENGVSTTVENGGSEAKNWSEIDAKNKMAALESEKETVI